MCILNTQSPLFCTQSPAILVNHHQIYRDYYVYNIKDLLFIDVWYRTQQQCIQGFALRKESNRISRLYVNAMDVTV
jgi:hypothetical protein